MTALIVKFAVVIGVFVVLVVVLVENGKGCLAFKSQAYN